MDFQEHDQMPVDTNPIDGIERVQKIEKVKPTAIERMIRTLKEAFTLEQKQKRAFRVASIVSALSLLFAYISTEDRKGNMPYLDKIREQAKTAMAQAQSLLEEMTPHNATTLLPVPDGYMENFDRNYVPATEDGIMYQVKEACEVNNIDCWHLEEPQIREIRATILSDSTISNREERLSGNPLRLNVRMYDPMSGTTYEFSYAKDRGDEEPMMVVTDGKQSVLMLEKDMKVLFEVFATMARRGETNSTIVLQSQKVGIYSREVSGDTTDYNSLCIPRPESFGQRKNMLYLRVVGTDGKITTYWVDNQEASWKNMFDPRVPTDIDDSRLAEGVDKQSLDDYFPRQPKTFDKR